MDHMEPMHQLSELQLAVMRALWEQGEGTVAQVHARLQEERGLAITTVATVLSRLEKRGLVEHRRDGRQFIYRPLVSDREVQRSMLEELTDRVYQGDVTSLVSHLLHSRDVSSGDLARVKELIEAKARSLQADAPPASPPPPESSPSSPSSPARGASRPPRRPPKPQPDTTRESSDADDD
jgi:BlaI family penicillinase repressor